MMFLCLAQAIIVAFVSCVEVPTAKSLCEQQYDYCSSSCVCSLYSVTLAQTSPNYQRMVDDDGCKFTLKVAAPPGDLDVNLQDQEPQWILIGNLQCWSNAKGGGAEADLSGGAALAELRHYGCRKSENGISLLFARR